jgi:hypothetical protein
VVLRKEASLVVIIVDLKAVNLAVTIADHNKEDPSVQVVMHAQAENGPLVRPVKGVNLVVTIADPKEGRNKIIQEDLSVRMEIPVPTKIILLRLNYSSSAPSAR